MAHEITLPTEEDSKVNVHMGDQTITFDLMEYEEILEEAYKAIRESGTRDRDAFLESFQEVFSKRFNIKLSKSSTGHLLFFLDDCLRQFKKKFAILLDSIDSTETSEDLSQTSNSSASTSESL